MKEPSEWDLDEVSIWLNAIGLGSKTDAFRENAIDGEMLVTLNEPDFVELGLTSLQGKKIKRCLEDLASGGGGGGEELTAKVQELEKENADLKNEVAALRIQMQEMGHPSAPPPQKAAPAPAPAPAPKQSNQHEVVKGAAGGAAKGAVLGAVAGAIAGDPAQGAKMGAAVGATGGAMQGMGARRRRMMR